jgi:transposase
LLQSGVAALRASLGLKEVRRVPGRKQQPFRELLECLRDRQGDVLRFAYDLRIPPTSNQAERDLRPAKTQQKISGRLRSESATRHRYAIRGYIDTARNHGESALTAIHEALAGNPWMPPIPQPRNAGWADATQRRNSRHRRPKPSTGLAPACQRSR